MSEDQDTIKDVRSFRRLLRWYDDFIGGQWPGMPKLNDMLSDDRIESHLVGCSTSSVMNTLTVCAEDIWAGIHKERVRYMRTAAHFAARKGELKRLGGGKTQKQLLKDIAGQSDYNFTEAVRRELEEMGHGDLMPKDPGQPKRGGGKLETRSSPYDPSARYK